MIGENASHLRVASGPLVPGPWLAKTKYMTALGIAGADELRARKE
jgi:hypothetical protein